MSLGMVHLFFPKNPGMSDWKGNDYPYIPMTWGWDLDPQSSSTEGSGFLGFGKV